MFDRFELIMKFRKLLEESRRNGCPVATVVSEREIQQIIWALESEDLAMLQVAANPE